MWVSGAGGKFDQEGNLTDEGVKKQLEKYLTGLVDFVNLLKAWYLQPVIADFINFIRLRSFGKLRATVRCHPGNKADIRGGLSRRSSQYEDGYLSGTSNLPEGIHFSYGHLDPEKE